MDTMISSGTPGRTAWAMLLVLVLLSTLIGFGIWAGVLVLGVDIGVVPFLGWADGYDYADDWGALSVLVAMAATMTAWWLLRRCVDQVGRR